MRDISSQGRGIRSKKLSAKPEKCKKIWRYNNSHQCVTTNGVKGRFHLLTSLMQMIMVIVCLAIQFYSFYSCWKCHQKKIVQIDITTFVMLGGSLPNIQTINTCKFQCVLTYTVTSTKIFLCVFGCILEMVGVIYSMNHKPETHEFNALTKLGLFCPPNHYWNRPSMFL